MNALGRRDDYRDVADAARCPDCGHVGMAMAHYHGPDGEFDVMYRCPACGYRESV
jgi:predicted RNA-binding Zn-ribbon protein involved in translation (DUF1610 family)